MTAARRSAVVIEASAIAELRRDDRRYPRELDDLERAPDPLWLSGEIAWLERRPRVAIVGTRRPTAYGDRITRDLAGSAARAGAVVLSGLATGIDSAAHVAALDAGGPSLAVLGEGIASFRSGAGRRRRRIGEGCLMLSPYAPLAPAQPWMFASRNAIIAALAAVVVVVEAPAGSGALITAADARRLGRTLLAVPGPLGAFTSVGTNALIADGVATALTGADALRSALGLARDLTTPPVPSPLAQALAAGPLAPDALAASLGMSTAQVAASAAMDPDVAFLADGRLARR